MIEVHFCIWLSVFVPASFVEKVILSSTSTFVKHPWAGFWLFSWFAFRLYPWQAAFCPPRWAPYLSLHEPGFWPSLLIAWCISRGIIQVLLSPCLSPSMHPVLFLPSYSGLCAQHPSPVAAHSLMPSRVLEGESGAWALLSPRSSSMAGFLSQLPWSGNLDPGDQRSNPLNNDTTTRPSQDCTGHWYQPCCEPYLGPVMRF